jgi:pSer/pThr/pTyr-binding forkhead associated (FHA) protein
MRNDPDAAWVASGVVLALAGLVHCVWYGEWIGGFVALTVSTVTLGYRWEVQRRSGGSGDGDGSGGGGSGGGDSGKIGGGGGGGRGAASGPVEEIGGGSGGGGGGGGGSSARIRAAARRPLSLRLRVEGGPLHGARFDVDRSAGPTAVGRHTSNTIVLPEAAVSRHHCKVEYRSEAEGGDHRFYVVDVGSTTGTFFYLPPLAPFALSRGSTVKAGESLFRVASCDVNSGPPQLSLLFEDGPHRGKTQTIGERPVTIGRASSCAIAIADDNVLSNAHCRVEFDGERFVVMDLESTNGTGMRLSEQRETSESYPLELHSLFGCGVTKFQVESVKLEPAGTAADL